jgi:hypothetical protein
LLAINVLSNENLECSCARFRHSQVLFSRAAAYAHGVYRFSAAFSGMLPANTITRPWLET